jgi:N-acetylglucosaminyldiphosphoundecaprenol N-acetyl-beta-D-mannosaminyltransferase
MNILGVRIDNFSKQEILEKVALFLSEPKFHRIATVNPEFILEAQKNTKFKDVLNNCDLNIADGIGIKFAFWRYGRHLRCRMAGIDLMKKILKIASDRKLGIFLAANKDGLSTWEETRDAILKVYPNIIINGVALDRKEKNYVIASGTEWSEAIPKFNAMNTKIAAITTLPRNDKIDILFCNFGAPFQELFINRIKCDNIRLAIGVGGSFDFLTGKTKRAPVLVCKLGFEWLWRLLQKPDHQPRRWKRIWNAVVIFPVKIISGL